MDIKLGSDGDPSYNAQTPNNITDVRKLFIDPKGENAAEMSQAFASLFEALLTDPSLITNGEGNAVIPFALEVARMMSGARKFDHNSMAQLHPNGNVSALIAHMASTFHNNNTIIGEVSPVETQMEIEAIDWLIKNVAGYNELEASGAIVTGGSLANLTALLVARERLSLEGWNPNAMKPAAVLCTPMAHYSVNKAVSILSPASLIPLKEGGYERQSAIKVISMPMQEGSYRMDIRHLYDKVRSLRDEGRAIMAIVGIAGETETGQVDSLSAIARIAEEFGVYFHVDAAYGGPFTLSRKGNLFKGIERSDSITVDPHKYLYTPYAAGAVLFRSSADHSILAELNKAGSQYMFKDGSDRGDHSFKEHSKTYLGSRRVEGSMGGQGAAATWAVTKALGVDGIAALLNHTLDLTDLAYRKLLESNVFKIAHGEPDLNTVCFYPFDEKIEKIFPRRDQKKQLKELYGKLIEKTCADLEKDHGIYISTTSMQVPTEVRGERNFRKVIRFVPTHPYTTTEHVENALEKMHELWEKNVRELTEEKN